MRHGANGKKDYTMATKEAKILIPWVAQNADGAEFITDKDGNISRSDRFFDSNGKRSPEIRLQKATETGIVFVSECVPDNANKRVWITSAYANKKGSKGQLLNMEEKTSPQPTPKASFDSIATTINISQPAEKVNDKLKVRSKSRTITAKDSLGNEITA